MPQFLQHFNYQDFWYSKLLVISYRLLPHRVFLPGSGTLWADPVSRAWNHRVIWVGKDLKDLVPTSVQSWGMKPLSCVYTAVLPTGIPSFFSFRIHLQVLSLPLESPVAGNQHLWGVLCLSSVFADPTEPRVQVHNWVIWICCCVFNQLSSLKSH